MPAGCVVWVEVKGLGLSKLIVELLDCEERVQVNVPTLFSGRRQATRAVVSALVPPGRLIFLSEATVQIVSKGLQR